MERGGLYIPDVMHCPLSVRSEMACILSSPILLSSSRKHSGPEVIKTMEKESDGQITLIEVLFGLPKYFLGGSTV